MNFNFKTPLAVALTLVALHSNSDAFGLSVPLLIGAGAAADHVYAKHKDAARSDSVHAASADVAMPTATGTFSGCEGNFATAIPPAVKDLQTRKARALCFSGFAVLHSGLTKTPIYSAEVLNRSRVQNAKGEQRTNKFFADARLPSAERASLADYVGSGFDRGHNSPAGDQDSPEGMAQSFSLANMMPQAPQNNRGAWAMIEKSTRKYAERASGDVYVITGSILIAGQCPNFDVHAFKLSGYCTIGSGVTVPSHIYKLVYDATTKRAWAYWIENTDSAPITRPITYDELVKRTGIEFLPGIHPAS